MRAIELGLINAFFSKGLSLSKLGPEACSISSRSMIIFLDALLPF